MEVRTMNTLKSFFTPCLKEALKVDNLIKDQLSYLLTQLNT